MHCRLCATPARAPKAAWRTPLAALCGALRAPLAAAPDSEAPEPAGAHVRLTVGHLMVLRGRLRMARSELCIEY